ncbi:MAG TPA: hypothetical protein VF622_19465 [Segetibacter sp.]|jgi:hypothetical protein
MRVIYILPAILLWNITILAQDFRKVSVAEGTDIKDAVGVKQMFSYPDFTMGKVFFKEGGQASARLNYNLLVGQIQFINTNGDTLSLDNEYSIREITIGKDIFYFDKVYLKLVNGTEKVKLAFTERIKISDKLKSGGYGQPLSTSSVNSLSSVTDGSRVIKLNVNQQLILATDKKFYIGDRFNHFAPLNKKNLMKMFSKQQNAIEEYLRENSINFNEEIDVLKLLSFLQKI